MLKRAARIMCSFQDFGNTNVFVHCHDKVTRELMFATLEEFYRCQDCQLNMERQISSKINLPFILFTPLHLFSLVFVPYFILF